ncbi:MAG: DNA polymerase III subunit gamma/tau [Chthonomonadales bacterium]
MAYVSLYRKYRSQSFAEVVGQNHVTVVLQNALRSGKIAHAYLFCGPRGCGKTSTARLLAKALNCQSFPAPTPEPCGVCDLCVRIRDGSAMDVIEMDAASETGIDDVREKIIENARYAPVEARYKVYIIDEVHDLSAKAFDALLKTLEEPPAHVVFILATTEPRKVPITVRSRCQRLDFRRGTFADLSANLKRVLDAEQIPYEDEAVAALARAAEGSYRDSLSLLEQVLAYSDGRLTVDAVHSAIGSVGPDLLDEVVRTIARDDMAEAFILAGKLVDSGKDVRQVLSALQLHLRDVLVASIAESAEALPEVSPQRFQELKEQAALFTAERLLAMIAVLADTERDLRFTNQHRLLLERAFWSIIPSAIKVQEVARAEAAAQEQPSVPGTSTHAHLEAVRQKPSAPTAGSPEEASPPAPPATLVELDAAAIRRIWPKVCKGISARYPAAAGVLNGSTVIGLEGSQVLVGFPDQFRLERAQAPKRLAVVEEALARELGGARLKVRCVLAPAGGGPSAGAGDHTAEPATPQQSLAQHTEGAEEIGILKAVEDAFPGMLQDE